MAIDLEMILWDDLPPGFDSKFKVPHKIDYGVDLVTLDYSKSCQVKLYNENQELYGEVVEEMLVDVMEF